MGNMTPFEWAKWYHEQGLCVIPARNKRPIVDWTQYQEQRPSVDQLAAWFKGETFSRGLQLFAIAGRVSGFVVLDIDSIEGDEFWRGILGDRLLDTTAALESGSQKGYLHYWFQLGEQDQESRAAHHDKMHWDLRSDGGGTVLPPSIHESGHEYVWVRDLSHIQPWPYPDIPGKGINSVEGGERSSGLAHLLTHPGEGGRNNWVTAVLGHYAKRLDFEDGYRAQAEMIWDVATSIPHEDEYTRQEFEATVESVWTTEKRKVDQTGGEWPTRDSGYLISHGNQIFALCKEKQSKEELLLPVSDFGIRCTEKVIAVDDTTSYVVTVTKRDDELIEYVLDGEVLGSSDKLKRWLAARDLIYFGAAPGDQGQAIGRTERFHALLVSHEPVVVESVPHMGHYSHEVLGDIYVTSHGVIDQDGPRHEKIRPDASKFEYQKAWEYGFSGSQAEAQAVLREVMTFHDPVTTSMFGSLWALAPVKGAVMKATSLFPHMALIAPSESGKTNGFFSLMLQLNGRTHPGGTFTAASLRDELSVHRSGFVWIDDPSNTDDLGELLRGAAGEGEHARKGGQNWSKTISTHLVAPIVLSAEGMEMLKERAMMDRTVQVVATSPTGRESRHHPGQVQWEDIARLMRTGPLSRYAGWYVQLAMQWLESIGGPSGMAQMVHDLRVGSGRQAEKMGLIRVGARALKYVMGSYAEAVDVPGYYPAGGGDPVDVCGIVDAWAQGDTRESARGAYLTSVVIPKYFANLGYLPKAPGAHPAYIGADHTIRVNVAQLATWWLGFSRSMTNANRAHQLGSSSALAAEVQAMGWEARKVKGIRYRVCPFDISYQIFNELEMDPEEDPALVSED
jgi:hypothetical protein